MSIPVAQLRHPYDGARRALKLKENAMDAPDQTERADRPSEGLRRATGRDRPEWFAALDAWGAASRQYAEIAGWLVEKHAFSDWWAQKLTVEYEQARGLRAPGIRRDGTFEVGASKTVAVPVERLFDAFVDPGLRKRWLSGVVLRERDSQPGHEARFEAEGGTRIEVTFTADGAGKSQVALQHLRLPDARTAAEKKAFWRERLTALKTQLEG
jgi:uncharacterized protein YndB with AHSA1/START domain